MCIIWNRIVRSSCERFRWPEERTDGRSTTSPGIERLRQVHRGVEKLWHRRVANGRIDSPRQSCSNRHCRMPRPKTPLYDRYSLMNLPLLHPTVPNSKSPSSELDWPVSPRRSNSSIKGLFSLFVSSEHIDCLRYEVEIFEGRKWIGGKLASFVDKDGNHIEVGIQMMSVSRSVHSLME